MPDSTLNAELNALLIGLGRSLLQYTREAWPWTDGQTATVHAEMESLAERQSQLVADMADWLDQQQWPVDFGVYPAAYTDLHYVSLAYLMAETICNAEELTAKVAAVRERFRQNEEATSLLNHILAEQKAVAAKLRELADGLQAEHAA